MLKAGPGSKSVLGCTISPAFPCAWTTTLTQRLWPKLCAAQAGNSIRFFYVTLGSGVGGGLVSRGIIWHGTVPGESEIGHLRLDKLGTIVEARCAGWSVDKRIREEIAAHPESMLARLVGRSTGGEAKHLRKAIEGGDPLAIQIMDETTDDLAFAISHVTHLVHPEVVVLGGGLSLAGEVLRQRVERNVSKYLMDAFLPGPKIRTASLGEDVVTVGALLLAKQAKDLE